MSSNYFLKKWKEVLIQLEELLNLDSEFQNTKLADKTLCEGMMRITGILGRYIEVYNKALDCLEQNVQVQKTKHIADVVKAVINRIIELKHQITKLESSEVQFLNNGLAFHKLTPFDAELSQIPIHIERPEEIRNLITEAFQKAKEKREELRRALEGKIFGLDDIVDNWWDDKSQEDEVKHDNEVQVKDSEETLHRRALVTMIQAQERSRLVIQNNIHQSQKRALWKKQLTGDLKPIPRLELRERSAMLIQKVLREYFKLKRLKKRECLRDEILGIRMCNKRNIDESALAEQILAHRQNMRKKFEQEWQESCENLKHKFMNMKMDEMREDYRDFIRNWFRKWYDDIMYFHDIPKPNEGGSALIMKEEIPDPAEWWEEYKQYLADKNANKNKSMAERKLEKIAAKKEANKIKKEERMKLKRDADLMKKMMKNPKLHPGYQYPISKKMEQIYAVLEEYNKYWAHFDRDETQAVKQGFVKEIDIENIYAKIKIEVFNSVYEDMCQELKLLKNALKTDYTNNGITMPEPMKTSKKRKKKKKSKGNKINFHSIPGKLEELAYMNILKQYPKTKLEDFEGEFNYAGDDMRCNYQPAESFSGELRALWWDRCREASHGFHKILIVGPRKSGKTVLVQALATINDAILFELSPELIETSSDEEIQKIMMSVVDCARAVQPAVIYIRHVHVIFNKTTQREGSDSVDNSKLLRKLCKKIQAADKITLIASCVDPWRTKSAALLKQLPAVVLVPNTGYTAVVRLLTCWVAENHNIPRGLDVQSLARVLRGYSYGYLMEALTEFLSPERIVKMAAYGLSPQEIYDFVLSNESETKVEYEKYLKWYRERTAWGRKEKKHIEEQLEFKRAMEIYEEKAKKKKKAK